MSANGYNLDATIATLADAYEQARQEAEVQAERLAELRGEEKRIEKALRALAPEHPAVQVTEAAAPKRAAPGSLGARWRNYNIDPDKFALVWMWIREHGADDFTKVMVSNALKGKVSVPTSDRAIEKFRDAEAIRKVGTSKGGGGRYRLLDEDAAHRLLASNADAYRAGPHAAR